MENLEIHYYLENDLHSMDAFIKNKAEAELLKIFKEIANVLELDLSLEIEAVKEGGIKEFFKILNSKKNRKQTQRVLIAIGVIFSGVVTNIISDQFTKNSELEELQIEESKLSIQKLKRDLVEEENPTNYNITVVNNITFKLANNDKIKFHRSNFYTQLLAEPKVEKVSITELDENRKPISEEKSVNRSDFKNFVIEKVKIESEFVENANIEIVSPVLKSGKMKWRGYYDAKPISFNLVDSEFKNMVLNKEVSFVNGTSIKCTMELQKEMDDDGNVKITEINVYDVTNIFEGKSTIVTKRGKQIIEARNQIKLTFDELGD